MPTERDVPCTTCPLEPARRAFLRDAAAASVAALLSLGATPLSAAARALAFVAPLRVAGDERVYPIPATDGATIDRDDEVILVRWEGFVYAFNLACPHKNTALRWLDREQRFQCPKHKSKYRPDGSFIEGRATRGMDRFSIRRQDATVVVDLGRLHRQSDEPEAWEGARVAL